MQTFGISLHKLLGVCGLKVVTYVTNGMFIDKGGPSKWLKKQTTSSSTIHFSQKSYRWFGIKDDIVIKVEPYYHSGVIFVI